MGKVQLVGGGLGQVRHGAKAATGGAVIEVTTDTGHPSAFQDAGRGQVVFIFGTA